MESHGRIFTRQNLVLVALILGAIVPGALMWRWVSGHWVPLPFWDEWHTPGSQFESWYRGTLTWREMFSQHNESRNFFPRLLYFALQFCGGWDVRKEMRVVFLGVCALCLLLLHLLRRTPGATSISTLAGWSLMTYLCFAPAQVLNFLYGIEIETFFPGFALLAAAAVNLSALAFRWKTLLNLTLAFIATYTFANGMLVWALAWPLPAPNESTSARRRLRWTVVYGLVGAIFVGAYFIGYQRPSYHPPFISLSARFVDFFHYIILWCGNYFATSVVGPFALGLIALGLFFGGTGFALWTVRQSGEWRTFYPWLLLGAFACATVAITAIGRLGFGVEQALENRYLAFSRYFYIALFGLFFAIYCARVREAAPQVRAIFLTNAGWLIGLLALSWLVSYRANARVVADHRRTRSHLLLALEWIEPIPDNPDLKRILPFPEALRAHALFLAEHHVLRLPFVRDALAAAVRQSPPPAEGMHGQIESAQRYEDGMMELKGWAWLPERNQPADCVVLGVETVAGNFKPVTVIETGKTRRDLAQKKDSNFLRAGFVCRTETANFPSNGARMKGWAVDLRAQKAWPLASALEISGALVR